MNLIAQILTWKSKLKKKKIQFVIQAWMTTFCFYNNTV